jgi:hypothetical protein
VCDSLTVHPPAIEDGEEEEEEWVAVVLEELRKRD